MVIDLPPLIDFTADDDDWVPPKAIMAPPPPRPPLFGGYGAAPAAPAPPAAAAAGTGGFRPAAASGTVVAAGRGAGDAAGTGILSISGRPTAKGPLEPLATSEPRERAGHQRVARGVRTHGRAPAGGEGDERGRRRAADVRGSRPGGGEQRASTPGAAGVDDCAAERDWARAEVSDATDAPAARAAAAAAAATHAAASSVAAAAVDAAARAVDAARRVAGGMGQV